MTHHVVVSAIRAGASSSAPHHAQWERTATSIDARVQRIYAGSNEIMKLIIARSL